MSTPTASTTTDGTIDVPYGQQIDAADVPYSSQVAQARQRFEAAHAKLFRSDKAPIYTPEEHNARHAALVATFDGTVQPFVEALETYAQDAETAVQAVQMDPVKRLGDADMARASSLFPVFKDDFERLPLGELVEQCQGALARNDAVEIALCERFGRMRFDAERAKHPAIVMEGGQPAVNRTHNPDAALVAALATALNTMHERNAPKDLGKKVDAAARAKAELLALRRLAGTTRSTIDGSQARTEAQMRARYGL